MIYKETHYNATVDPQDPPTWTGSWMDPRFSPPADGGRPQNALTGQLFVVNSGTTDMTVPAQYGKLRFWRGTQVANLGTGQSITLDQGVGTLGYEWDVDADNGSRPAGLMDMSSTTSNSAEDFTDFGGTTQLNSTATHHLTLYRAPSGALVFGAGTVQWAWGLDNGGTSNPTDQNMQQATVNLFADMGVQPTTVMSGLTAATASTDATAPTSTITSPAAGANLTNGSAVTISGSATDAGGGVVTGVEVSTDGGTTWHPVTTMSNPGTAVTWSYSWVAHGSPSATIKSRAVDDSGNLESPSLGKTVNMSCPCSIWGSATAPKTVDSGDASSIEVGVKFQVDTFGVVTGIRFYKASTNTGTHVGNLWTANGQLLASATFTGESASGWQQVNFAQPVSLNKNTTYIASYFAPNGHYSQNLSYFYATPPLGPAPTITDVDSPPLHALRNSNGVVNGVYSFSSTSIFPTSSSNASNYWVDPVFTTQTFTTPPGQVGNIKATAGYASASLTWSAPTTGDPATAYKITPYIGSTAQSPTTVTGNPAPTSALVSGLTNGATYTFTVTASNPAGTGPESAPSNAVTPNTNIVGSVWQNGTPTGAADASDTTAVNLGLKFQASSDGYLAGVRFYKYADNTGTHIGNLWSSTGTLLASGTFSNETGNGWQELDFSTPVTITANTTYVVSYHTNAGHYAITPNGLAAAVTNGPLTALASGGVYGYGAANAFPSASFNASNYWVDVVYTQSGPTPPPTVTAVTPTNGSTGNPVSVTPTATFSQAVVPNTVSFTVKDSGGSAVAGAVSFNAGNTVATFTPTSSLTANTTYTATVSGAQNASGTPMTSPFAWTFTTGAASQCPCSVWQNAAPSGAVDATDTTAVNLGLRFQASSSGKIIGVRFYKESANTGTHIGSLWTSSGTMLATGTFGNETASGWQELDFASPVTITANTTYVVSYHTDAGHYAFTSSGLSSAVTNGPLTASASGGVYAYGSGNAFPSNSFNASNYWVDVVYSP